MVEKIKVNLSYSVYNLLLHDMEDFKFDIKDDIPNKNLFYNTIVKNMVSRRKQESEYIRSQLSKTLEDNIKSTKLLNTLLDQLEDLYNYKIEDKTNRSHGYYISFRPSKKLADIYEEIEEYELKGNTISNYYRNLFNDYARLPQDERERIIFADIVLLIESAITNKRILNITLTNDTKMEFIPYALVRTNDELYNYLIGGIRRGGQIRCFPLHLYKCANSIKTKMRYSLTDEEIKYLEEQIERGPRNIERRSITTKVKLTKKGIKFFKSFYLNRPIPLSIEDDIYTFNTSQDELLLYFSRFGGEAYILEPLQFQNQMKRFHKKAFFNYNEKKETFSQND